MIGDEIIQFRWINIRIERDKNHAVVEYWLNTWWGKERSFHLQTYRSSSVLCIECFNSLNPFVLSLCIWSCRCQLAKALEKSSIPMCLSLLDGSGKAANFSLLNNINWYHCIQSRHWESRSFPNWQLFANWYLVMRNFYVDVKPCYLFYLQSFLRSLYYTNRHFFLIFFHNCCYWYGCRSW